MAGGLRLCLATEKGMRFFGTMRLKHGIDLGYCTNIHRGETWAQTFTGLRDYTDAVRLRVSPDAAYGIGLRLSAEAAAELAADTGLRDGFRRWMEEKNSYVFTINGFPYGTFHGSRVKEQVYVPDWTTPERLVYTNRLFDLISEFAPSGESVSVSTLPGSFKEFIKPGTASAQRMSIYKTLSHSGIEPDGTSTSVLSRSHWVFLKRVRKRWFFLKASFQG